MMKTNKHTNTHAHKTYKQLVTTQYIQKNLCSIKCIFCKSLGEKANKSHNKIKHLVLNSIGDKKASISVYYNKKNTFIRVFKVS